MLLSTKHSTSTLTYAERAINALASPFSCAKRSPKAVTQSIRQLVVFRMSNSLHLLIATKMYVVRRRAADVVAHRACVFKM